MNTTINSESKTEFHFILNVIKKIIAATKQPDNQAILDHINKTSATIMDQNYLEEIISSMLEKQLIYEKPSKKGMSHYIMEQMNDDIDNNTNNTNENQITNIDNSQELFINTSDNDKKSTEQGSREPAINEGNTTTGLQNKRRNYNILEDNVTTLIDAFHITQRCFKKQLPKE